MVTEKEFDLEFLVSPVGEEFGMAWLIIRLKNSHNTPLSRLNLCIAHAY